MILEDLHEMGTELEYWLRMRVHPIAVKLLRNREEVPEGLLIQLETGGTSIPYASLSPGLNEIEKR